MPRVKASFLLLDLHLKTIGTFYRKKDGETMFVVEKGNIICYFNGYPTDSVMKIVFHNS